MSVTFWMPQAPQVRIEPYPDDEPGYFEIVPASPFTELNMANSNAADLLELLGKDTEYLCGEWEAKDIDAVYVKTMILLNKRPDVYMRDTVVEDNFISCGRDMSYVTRRLTDMLELLKVAREHGFCVCFG